MREPDMQGPHARAWELPLDPRTPTALSGGWMVHAPGSHPFWPWHFISITHLRDEPGVPPADLAFPEATHELIVLALDPDHYPPPLDGSARIRAMYPPDVVQQMVLPDDSEARKLLWLVIRAVCDGVLIPDQDYRQSWADAIEATAEHSRQGGHG